MAGPVYAKEYESKLPPGDDESPMVLAIPATYFEAPAVSDQCCAPVGSNTTLARGLHAASRATISPALLVPRLRSYRRPRLAVRRSVTRQLSPKNPECVRKCEPSDSTRIGCHVT